MTICFEGPSAVGKTVLSSSFSDSHTIIPEVNLLFGKQFRDDLWYYEKQVERYQMSQQSEKDSIFDGDIFQPLWYNWIYGYPAQFHSASTIHQFYLEQLEAGRIQFPDIYFVFETDLNTLRKRKESDESRSRSNFEKHLKMIKPQKKYFEFLRDHTNLVVEFIQYDTIENCRRKVVDIKSAFISNSINQVEAFLKIKSWLDQNSPELSTP